MIRVMVDVLGANANTFSSVVGAFFLGLSLGAWVASRRVPSREALWQSLGLVEVTIAVLALLPLVAARHAVWLHGTFPSSQWLKPALSLMLVTPTATMMGLVLPWMLHAIGQAGQLTPRRSVVLYAVNTAGGVVGIWYVLLLGLPTFGLVGTSVSVTLLNISAAGCALYLQRFHVRLAQDRRSPLVGQQYPTLRPTQSSPDSGRAFSAILAFASGFLVLGIEVTCQIQFRQVSIMSLFSSAGVLTMVLLGLSLSALLLSVSAGRPNGANSRTLLSGALLITSAACAIEPLVFVWFYGGLSFDPYALPFINYALHTIGAGGLTIVPILMVAGLVLPLLLYEVTADNPLDAGRRVGRLLMWNGIGGWLGSEVSHAWLLPSLGLWRAMTVFALAYLVLFLALTTKINVKVAAVGFTSVLILLCAYISGSLPQVAKFSHPESQVVDVAVGREGVVAVVQRRPGDLALVKNNTYVLGSSAAQFDQERQAHIPLLLHGNARDVAAIGVATGGTIGGIVLHSYVEHVDAIELSPLALEFARIHFGPFNRAVADDPRMEMHQEDARWVIAGKSEAYDVIIGDLFEPWGTGVGRLYTIQHLLAVRNALKPGGLFCQWLPMIQLTRLEFDSIVRTFQEVFPHTVLIRRDFYVEQGILGLVGNLDPQSHDWRRVSRACEKLRTLNQVRDPISRHVDGIAMMVVGSMTGDLGVPRNTLGNAWLELHAANNILIRRDRWFNDAHLVRYVGELHQRNQSLMPTALRSVHEVGQFFFELELAFEQEPTNWKQLSAQAQRRMPDSIAGDSGIDWTQWPMNLRPGNK